jgi:hypothetical protein
MCPLTAPCTLWINEANVVTKPNMAAGCKSFYQAVSGDYCYGVATSHGTDVATFETWNPDTGTDPNSCTLWLGYYYCVGH